MGLRVNNPYDYGLVRGAQMYYKCILGKDMDRYETEDFIRKNFKQLEVDGYYEYVREAIMNSKKFLYLSDKAYPTFKKRDVAPLIYFDYDKGSAYYIRSSDAQSSLQYREEVYLWQLDSKHTTSKGKELKLPTYKSLAKKSKVLPYSFLNFRLECETVMKQDVVGDFNNCNICVEYC